jgi:hypothetical protein
MNTFSNEESALSVRTKINANFVEAASHIIDVANPHGVTPTQIGLGNVDNTSDLNKPISTSTQSALDLKLSYYPHITTLTGGNPVSLDYVATTSLSAKALVMLVIANEPQTWILVLGTSSEASSYTSVVPIDYATTTNEKYWLKIS